MRRVVPKALRFATPARKYCFSVVQRLEQIDKNESCNKAQLIKRQTFNLVTEPLIE
jgi:hypothetical protein